MSILSILAISNSTSRLFQELPVQFNPINLIFDTSKPAYFSRVQFLLPVFGLLIVILVSFDKKYFRVLYRRKNVIDQIPGPPGIPLLGNLVDIFTEKDLLARLSSLAQQYQPYYRLQLGPTPVVVLTAPEAIEKLLSSNEDGHLCKADEYTALADYFDDGLVTSEGDKWRDRRKLFSPLFNYKCFPHFLEVFNRQSKLLINDLDLLFKDEESKPIQNTIYESLLKIICETAMGVELNDTSEGFYKFFEEAERTKEYIWYKVTRPWYQIKWIWKIHPFRRTYEENMKYIKDYISEVIREARTKFVETQEMPIDLDSNANNKTKKVMDAMLEKGLTDADIREEAHTIISAGHETSGSAIQFTLMFLALYPEHQEKCFLEVEKIINDEQKCPGGNFTMSSVADLKHTERCIKEALRIYPIAYMTARKIKSPLKMDKVFPPETTFVIFATDLHRNPKIFPEPEKFDPSRFTPENCALRHQYSYIPFSGGPRICLGYKFAMVQMKLVIARILHNFIVSTTDQLEDVPLDTSIVLTPVRGYNFLLKKRNPIPDSGDTTTAS